MIALNRCLFGSWKVQESFWWAFILQNYHRWYSRKIFFPTSPIWLCHLHWRIRKKCFFFRVSYINIAILFHMLKLYIIMHYSNCDVLYKRAYLSSPQHHEWNPKSSKCWNQEIVTEHLQHLLPRTQMERQELPSQSWYCHFQTIY